MKDTRVDTGHKHGYECAPALREVTHSQGRQTPPARQRPSVTILQRCSLKGTSIFRRCPEEKQPYSWEGIQKGPFTYLMKKVDTHKNFFNVLFSGFFTEIIVLGKEMAKISRFIIHYLQEWPLFAW